MQASFQTQKRQSFPNDADYRSFLRQSGMTQADILLRVRLELLSQRIRDKISKQAKVTDAQIATYYRRNKQRFSQPQRRDLQVIKTRTAARANAAERAIRGGQPWPVVARRFSNDAVSKSQGGRLPDVIPGQQERALDNAVFRAQRGQLVGPVRTQFGYYVFRVTNIQPPTQQTLAQARTTIRQLLLSENQQKALQAFVRGFERKWKARTNCRKGYIIEKCRNAPARRGAPTRSRRAPCPSRALPPARRRRGRPRRSRRRPQRRRPRVGLPPSPDPPPGAVTQRDALGELDALTRRLRRECPWDREQDERSIVPHTVEEAYELADAVQGGDDARMLDELGDVLFQVVFLALLLEERGAGDLAAVADHCARKLVRRHPHVFGEAQARSAGEVLRNWDAIKASEPGRDAGTFADLPAALPALTLARKVRRRAAAAGFELPDGGDRRAALAERLGRTRRCRRPRRPVRAGGRPPVRRRGVGAGAFGGRRAGAARRLPAVYGRVTHSLRL